MLYSALVEESGYFYAGDWYWYWHSSCYSKTGEFFGFLGCGTGGHRVELAVGIISMG